MRHRLLARAAARVRRSLGHDELVRRLEAVETRLAAMGPEVRYPYGPVYLGDHTVLVATRWGGKLLADTRDAMVSPWLVLDGLWEAHVTDWMQRTLRPGQVFVDVGANVGYFTVLAGLRVGRSGRVVAVEAHPRLAELLHRNVVINGLHGHTTVWGCAAWSERTELKFHLRENFASNSSVGSAGADALAALGDTEELLEVAAAPLDELLADVGHVDVLKVDVEGAEVHVFAGLARTLAANPALTVLFEWSPAQVVAVGDDPAALLDLLLESGFAFRLLEEDLRSVDRARLLELPYGNVVATR
ncbi:MAG TPA: FkbM family methyltransferase [Acidimicrobiales bacterium]|nr:FkbM family methyltransferase [Acidimicrobiales bacterium]